LVLHEPIDFWGRLESSYLVHTELPIKEVSQSRALKLFACRVSWIIRKREQTKPRIPQLSQGLGYFSMARHRGDRKLDCSDVFHGYELMARASHHLKHRACEFAKRSEVARKRERLGIQYQLRKPFPHHAALTEDSNEMRRERFQIEQSLIDVEDKSGELLDDSSPT